MSAKSSHNASKKAPATDVLVVDDDVAQVEEIAQFLTRKGLNVATASDGLVALDMAQSLKPAVVVLDINLPAMNGDRLSEILRGLDHRTAVIMMSGHMDLYERVSGETDGFVAAMQKPVSLKALFETIDALLAG